VQRPNIRETMSGTSSAPKGGQASRFTPRGGRVDFSLVLDELWKAAQHELNFWRGGKPQGIRAVNPRIPMSPAGGDSSDWPRPESWCWSTGRRSDRRRGSARKAGIDPREISPVAGNFIKQCGRPVLQPTRSGNIRDRAGKIVCWILA
jgi:hypothetical protein